MDFDPIMVKTAIDGFRSAIDMVRSGISLAKDANNLAKDSSDKNMINQSLDKAEVAIKIAEVQVAQALGYNLCQCTFPPQIMLSIGRHNHGDEIFKCSRCSKQEPSEHYFRQMDEMDAYNSRDDDGWMRR